MIVWSPQSDLDGRECRLKLEFNQPGSALRMWSNCQTVQQGQEQRIVNFDRYPLFFAHCGTIRLVGARRRGRRRYNLRADHDWRSAVPIAQRGAEHMHDLLWEPSKTSTMVFETAMTQDAP